MKKIFWIILLLIPICTAKAETYYSDYSEWKEVEVIPDIASDLLEVKVEKRYLWYRKEKEGNYFKEGENHSEYPIATDFYRYSDWSSWSSVKIEESDYKEIESRKVYYYQTMKPVLFIRITKKSGMDAIYQNFQVYKNSKEVLFEEYDEDNNIILKLNEPCYVDELEVRFTILDETGDAKGFQIDWLNQLSERPLMENYSRIWFQGSYDKYYKQENMIMNSNVWEGEKRSLEKIESSNHQKVRVIDEYRYRERMNYYEKENKIYSSEYYAVSTDEFPYKDFTTEKIVYQIRTREKIEFDRNDFISLEEYTNQVNKLKNEVTLKEEEIKKLEDSILSKKNKIEELENKITSSNEEKELLQQEIEKLKNEILNFKENIKTLKLELEDKNYKIEFLSSKEKLHKEEIEEISKKEEDLVCSIEEVEDLKVKLEEANATIMSITNERSNQIEKENKQKIEIKKQTLPIPLLFLILILLGICISRIVAMKKKV